ncbi:DUF805 domain-containing protein [Falsibacillus albus]|uniref:DUF805 domain-containing protein n=1 Tax=Falsibacillus albus TaxID=2478915 RepID=A0A3L7JXL8_9BACI|nr:DUF805 domain-containing protein [Falsibacillus albus]RLQ94869.1 DUF805 domain-containing protein [Falsibacillus albus]
MEWYLKVLKNYVGFQGRARRKEYWMYLLINQIIIFILATIEYFADIDPYLKGIYYLATLLPALGVSLRRLHDTGKSGWWLLVALIPIVGIIVLIIFFCQSSQDGENKYGPNPKTA